MISLWRPNDFRPGMVSSFIPRRLRFAATRLVIVSGIFLGHSWDTVMAAPQPKNYVTVTFSKVNQNGLLQNVLTVAGDTGDNQVMITWKAGKPGNEGQVIVSTSGPTLIGTAASSVSTVSFPTGAMFMITGTLNGGNDIILLQSVSPASVNLDLGDGTDAALLVAVLCPTMSISLGAGNDQAKLTYCSVGNLSVDGGSGTNTFIQLTSKINSTKLTNIQTILP